MSLRIVGIDPSITGTGIATDGASLTVKHPASRKGDARLIVIRDTVELALLGGQPLPPDETAGQADLVVMEDMPRNAMSAGVTGMAHGLVREVCARHGVFTLLVPPATLKKYATNKGNATKDQMIGWWNAEHPERPLKDDNQVDASFLQQLGRDMECMDKGLVLPSCQPWRVEAVSKLWAQWERFMESRAEGAAA